VFGQFFQDPAGPPLSPLAVGDGLHIKVLGWQLFGCRALEKLRRLERTAIVILDLMARDAQKPGPQRGGASETANFSQAAMKTSCTRSSTRSEPRQQPPANECVDGIRVRIYKFRRDVAVLAGVKRDEHLTLP